MVARLAVAAGTAPPSTVALISLLGAVGGWATVMILDGTAPMQPRPWAPQPSDRDGVRTPGAPVTGSTTTIRRVR